MKRKTLTQKAIKHLSMACFMALEDMEARGEIVAIYQTKANLGGSGMEPTLFVDVKSESTETESIRAMCDRPDEPVVITAGGMLYLTMTQYHDQKIFWAINWAKRKVTSRSVSAPAVKVNFMQRGSDWYVIVTDGVAYAHEFAGKYRNVGKREVWDIDDANLGYIPKKSNIAEIAGHFYTHSGEIDLSRAVQVFSGQGRRDKPHKLSPTRTADLIRWAHVGARAVGIR